MYVYFFMVAKEMGMNVEGTERREERKEMKGNLNLETRKFKGLPSPG